jgi:tol-pal system protein YbgF
MNQARNHLRPALILFASLIIPLRAVDAATGADVFLEDRVARIERIMENQSASGLMLQQQQLQAEMQELRGLVETQQIEIQKLQRQLRDQYLDIDSRLGSGKGTDTPTTEAPTNGSTPATDATPAAVTDTLMPARPNGAIDASGLDLKPPVGTEAPARVTAPTPSSPRAVGIPSLPSPETTGGSERDAYGAAFDLLKQRKYPQAAEGFNDLLRRYPQGQYTDNARYWLAETYYVQRNYTAALAEFDRLVQLNPTSNKLPEALLKIGYIQYEQEAWGQARNAFKQVIARFPDSTEARLAKGRLDKIGPERR